MKRLRYPWRRPAAVIVPMLAAQAAGAAVWYVDASAPPGGDGSSWATAYRFLQDAITSPALQSGDEVRVAQGVHRPDEDALHASGTQDQEATFELVTGVAFYGGFPAGGGDGTFAARDPAAYPTVLDGDIFEPRGAPLCVEPGPGTGNCFETTAGTAGCNDAPCCDAVCDSLPLCCLLEWSEQCVSAALDACQRVYHVVFAFGVTGARLDGFIVTNGLADGEIYWDQVGAGLLARYSNPVVTGCTFTRNIALQGGAVFAYGGTADPRLINCVFHENDAGEGGALYATLGDPVMVNCLLSGNTAADGHGGAVFASAGNGSMHSCTCSGNWASEGGGCTFGLPAVRNSIAWDNSPDQIAGAIQVTFSCVQDGHPGPGNFATDPAFVDAAGGDFHLLDGSPCVNHGSNGLVPIDLSDLDGDLVVQEPVPLDLDRNLRIASGTVDVGAYESCNQGADLDGDGAVGIVDMLRLLIAWGTAPGGPPDLDGDGTVGIGDFLMLLAAWGPCA